VPFELPRCLAQGIGELGEFDEFVKGARFTHPELLIEVHGIGELGEFGDFVKVARFRLGEQVQGIIELSELIKLVKGRAIHLSQGLE